MSPRSALDHLVRLFRNGGAQRDIAALDARALDELGLTRGGLARIATTTAAVSDRMQAMSIRHGVLPERLARHAPDLAGMVESCRSCASVGACRAYLSDPTAGPAQAVFCPNHTTYEALCAARG